jgi:translation initiation factor 6
MFTNDKFCLLGEEVNNEKQKEIEKALGVNVYNVSVLGSAFVGIFITGNNDYLFVPQMTDNEEETIKKICKDNDMKMIVVKDRLNTIGNNMVIGDNKILLNPDYNEKTIKDLRNKTNYKVLKIKSKNFKAIGSTLMFLNGKYFLSQEYQEEEVKDILKQIGGLGTINKGSNYVASGIVGNSHGVIIGSMSTSVEIQNVLECLNFLS